MDLINELRVVQFWSKIIVVISMRSFDFEITRMISDHIALHSVQLPLWIARQEDQLLIVAITILLSKTSSRVFRKL